MTAPPALQQAGPASPHVQHYLTSAAAALADNPPARVACSERKARCWWEMSLFLQCTLPSRLQVLLEPCSAVPVSPAPRWQSSLAVSCDWQRFVRSATQPVSLQCHLFCLVSALIETYFKASKEILQFSFLQNISQGKWLLVVITAVY